MHKKSGDESISVPRHASLLPQASHVFTGVGRHTSPSLTHARRWANSSRTLTAVGAFLRVVGQAEGWLQSARQLSRPANVAISDVKVARERHPHIRNALVTCEQHLEKPPKPTHADTHLLTDTHTHTHTSTINTINYSQL